MEEIVEGDVVELKSGSHQMTVGKVVGDTATCVWEDFGRFRSEEFRVSVLKKTTT